MKKNTLQFSIFIFLILLNLTSCVGNKKETNSYRTNNYNVPTTNNYDHPTKHTVEQQQIWDNIISEINKLIIASDIKYSPLGAPKTSFEIISDNLYKISGQCTIIENNGVRILFSFKCTALADKYNAVIKEIHFFQ